MNVGHEYTPDLRPFVELDRLSGAQPLPFNGLKGS